MMPLWNQIKQKAWAYFTVKLVLFLIILFFLDFSIGHLTRYYFYKQECGRLYRAIYGIDRTKADILILGSSTAYHHYKPDIFEERTGETCYNMGSPGQGILFDYAVLKTALKRYTPKMIILDINLREFKYSRDYYDRLSFLLPFYREHEELHPIVELKSPMEKYKMVSSIYPFNSTFLIIAGGNSEYFKKRNRDMQGYKPLTRIWDQPMADWDLYEYPIDSVKLTVCRSLVEDCRKAGVKLVMVCSPQYKIFHAPEASIVIAKEIASDYGVPFLDFVSDTSLTNHRNYFDDAAHLNAEGSEIFSRIVMDKIDSLHLISKH